MLAHRTCVLGGIALLALGSCATAETEDPPASRGGTQSGGSSGKGGSGVGGGVFAGGSSGVGSGGFSASGGSAAAAGSGGASASGGSAGSGGSAAGGGSGGSPPAGALLFDPFEDGNTDGWIADTDGNDTVGNWALGADGSNNVYRQQTEYSDESWSIGGDIAWTDQRVQARVRFSASSGEGMALLAARLQNKSRYYFVEFEQNETDGTMKLRKEFDGATDDLVPSTDLGMPIVNDTWYTFALEAKGSTLTIYFGDTMIGTATDTALANGGIALGVVDAIADFDDVTVTVP